MLIWCFFVILNTLNIFAELVKREMYSFEWYVLFCLWDVDLFDMIMQSTYQLCIIT